MLTNKSCFDDSEIVCVDVSVSECYYVCMPFFGCFILMIVC